MANNVTIYLFGDNATGTTNNNNVLGSFPADGRLSLNYSVNDIKSLGSINSSFSRSFEVVGSDSVNNLFGQIFQISTQNLIYNQNKKVKAEVHEGDDCIMEGYLQLTSIKKEKESIIYTVVIYGGNDNLIKNWGDAYLTELDFEDSRHIYTANTMADSWIADNQLPYYYPLIDNGNDWQYDDMNGVRGSIRQQDLKPATNLYYLLNKAFDYAGKTFTSSILSSRRWRNVIIPFYGERLKFDEELINNLNARVGLTTTFSGTAASLASNLEYRIPLDLDNTGIYFDNGNNFDTTNNYYINNKSYSYRLNIYFQGRIKIYTYGSTQGFLYLTLKNDSTGVVYQTIPMLTQFQTYDFVYRQLTTITANPGDKIAAYFNFIYPNNAKPAIGQPVFELYDTYLRNGSQNYTFFDYKVDPFILVGTSITLKYAMPKNVKVVDLLKGIATAANLYIEPDKNTPNNFIIESRNDYYRNGQLLDWKDKFVVDKPVESQLLSEYQNKEILFTYKKDTDYFNDNYTTRAEGEIYGQKRIDLDNFVNGKKKIELPFAPSPLTKIIGNNEIVITKLGKQNDQFQWKAADSIIRLLNKPQDGYIPLTGSTIKFEGSGFTKYPYAGHFNRPYNETFDLNFDVARFYYYPNTGDTITQNNLYNLYWSNFIDEISSPDARIYTAYFNLNSQDIKNFRFCDRIYFEMDGQGQEFYVNKISDYQPGTGRPTKVELVKVLVLPESTKTVKPKEGERLRNPNEFGDNEVNSKALILAGYNNRISEGGQEGIIVGSDNTQYYNSRFNTIVGSGNTLGTDSYYNTILGGYQNNLLPGSSGNTIIGSSNSSFDAFISGSTILGLNNFTGQSSNTVYVAALSVNSGLTINGVNINQYWTASTGSNSLVRYPELGSVMGSTKGIITAGQNNTGGTAGSYQLIAQGFRNNTNYAFSMVLNGLYNSALSTKALVGSGFQNLASGFYSTILNGRGNSGATAYATIINGRDNYISGNTDTFGLIIQGRSNKIQRGYFSSIFNGDNNLIKDSTFSNIVAGNDMIISGYSVQSSIINGDENRIYGLGYHSLIGNGVLNIIKNNSGVVHNYNTIINGLENSIIANKYSTIINGGLNIINDCNNSTIVNGINNKINNSTGITLLSINNYTANSLSNTVIADRLILRSLTGSGYQYVVADANGELSLSAVTGSGSGSTVNNYYNNGYWQASGGVGSIIITGWSASVNATSDYSIVAGQSGSITNGDNNAIIGGLANSIDGNYCFIGGGNDNLIIGSNSYNSILNSYKSIINGKDSFENIINSDNCKITGDSGNALILNSKNSTINLAGSNALFATLIGVSGYTHTNTNSTDHIVVVNKFKHLGSVYSANRVIDNNYTANESDYLLLVKTGSGAITIKLPSSPKDGMHLIIKDYDGLASTNNITVDGGIINIDSTTTFTIDKDYASFHIIYSSGINTWSLINYYW